MNAWNNHQARHWTVTVITTAVGAEGLYGTMDPPGTVCHTIDTFSKEAAKLDQNQFLWDRPCHQGFDILNSRFSKKIHTKKVATAIVGIIKCLKVHREKHFIGQLFLHQTMQASKYLSKWIEAKNSLVSKTN